MSISERFIIVCVLLFVCTQYIIAQQVMAHFSKHITECSLRLLEITDE